VRTITGPALEGGEDARVRRRLQAPIEHHADERPRPVDVARSEQRVVAEQRAGADADRVHLGAKPVHQAPRAWTGDRRPLPGARGNPPVEAGARLGDDERAPVPHPREERRVEGAGGRRLDTVDHLDAPAPEIRETLPCDERIRVGHRRHDARDAGRDDAFDARARAPDVAAGFQGAVEGGPACPVSCGVERVHLGVRGAGTPVIPIADDHPSAIDDNGAHERIRARMAARTCCERECPLHQRGVTSSRAGGVYHCSWNSASTYSSGENGTRSSMPSPTPT
jgi:hypothetical protein